MFRRLSEALPLSEASLLAMRPALNAPVLNVGFVPVGPARAAIVAFAEEWGGIGFALGIRSNEGGQVVVFRNQESIEPEIPIPDVLEPVLAEAERMGFLFDEDMLDTKPAGLGRELAMALWGRLMGELEPSSGPTVARQKSAATEPTLDLPDRSAPVLTEFVLHEVAEADVAEISLDLEDELPAAFTMAANPAPRPAPPSNPEVSLPTQPLNLERSVVVKTAALPAPGKRVVPVTEAPPSTPPSSPSTPPSSPPTPLRAQLSKFRHLDELATATSEAEIDLLEMTDSGSKLGRIPIVRIRRERDGNKRIPYLARLLSSF